MSTPLNYLFEHLYMYSSIPLRHSHGDVTCGHLSDGLAAVRCASHVPSVTRQPPLVPTRLPDTSPTHHSLYVTFLRHAIVTVKQTA